LELAGSSQASKLPEKWLAVDPGESVGWSIWSGEKFIESGTETMWVFGDAVWQAAFRHMEASAAFSSYQADWDEPLADTFEGISLIVCENWSIYPWVAREGGLDWDECRTARLIGSLFQAARLAGWEWVQQDAKIKERAVAAGAENYFTKPLRENRHANDSALHGTFYCAVTRGEPWADLGAKDVIVDA
jgi:hypothetical protein